MKKNSKAPLAMGAARRILKKNKKNWWAPREASRKKRGVKKKKKQGLRIGLRIGVSESDQLGLRPEEEELRISVKVSRWARSAVGPGHRVKHV